MAQQQRHDPDPGVNVAPTASPNLALLHGGMLLSGFGTVFLGPALPALAAGAHASDGGSGLFFTAQFIGAFFGGVTTSRRLWRSLIRGSAAATIGFFLLGLCVRRQAPAMWDAAALLPLGFGVGQMLTSLNLLASRRFAAHRGAGLSLVNFSWSLGAVLAPFVLGTLLLSFSLGALLLSVTALFALALGTALWNGRGSAFGDSGPAEGVTRTSLPSRSAFYFALLLLLYGGVETSLSGWITTFGTRYGSGTLRSSTLGATALWIGITAGRALSSVVLRVVRERTFLISSLASAALLTAALSQAHGSAAIIVFSALLGLSLAPWFPLVLSAMLGEGAAASQVGTIIAVSGLGAAALPLLVGQISRTSGSLRVALLVPLCGLIALLFLSFRRAKQPSETAAAGV
jgi:FHS family glucose/mannose:H+ symporter-like MFS transporter